MAIEGDLTDMGLGSIIQVICLERKRGSLSVMSREQEGTIFFDAGEIVHAAVGDTEGVDAIYKLLTWDTGRFRLAELGAIPKKTIRMNWNHLLLDGLRQYDESNKVKPQQGASPLTRAQRDEDSLLESDLIRLMSQLEQYMYQVNKKKIHKKPLKVLELLADMVNEVINFCEVNSLKDPQSCSLTQALVAVVESYPHSRILHVTNNRLSVRTAWNMYKNWGDDPADRVHFARQICNAMREVMRIFFGHLAKEFHANEMNKQWTETYQVFLIELKRSMEAVQF